MAAETAFRYSPSHFQLGRLSAGRNIHTPLVRTTDNTLWLGKLCCPRDADPFFYERELYFSRPGRCVGVPIPDVEVATHIANRPELISALHDLPSSDPGLASIRWTDARAHASDWADEPMDLRDLPLLVAVRWVDGASTWRNWSGRPRDLANLSDVLQGLPYNLWIENSDDNVDLNVIVDSSPRA